jgi:hypothetical protein
MGYFWLIMALTKDICGNSLDWTVLSAIISIVIFLNQMEGNLNVR